MPAQPPAAREVQRVQIPQQPQRRDQDRGRGNDERRQPTTPRNQVQ
jgi:hypothetical protein